MTQEIYSLPTNGKGDRPRPYSPDKYAKEYDRIFKKKSTSIQKGDISEGTSKPKKSK
jgi:hypothetical protein